MNKYNSFGRLLESCKPLKILSRSLKDSTCNEMSINYCADIVKLQAPPSPSQHVLVLYICFADRQHDYENFLATLLMTKSLRSPALILRAFNVEIARIQDQTSDAQTAAFRLQFWQDTLRSIYKKEQTLQNVPANPVAQELYKICCCYGLQRRHLEKLISSRSTVLKSKYFRNIEDIERYAEDSVSSVYYLLLSIAGVKDIHADHAASHLGKAQGLTNILRSVEVSSYHKIVSLPMDVLMKHNVSQENVLRCVDSNNMRNVVFEVASRANNHLQKARSIDVPKLTKQIFLPATNINHYLSKLEQKNFNLFDRSLKQSSPSLPIKLYYNRILNRY